MTQQAASTKVSPVPEFASWEEEAHFWDTHDLTDYWNQLEPVEIEFATPLSEPVTLRIDIETMEEVRAIAEEQDLPPDVLLQVWILERRDAERQRRSGMAEPPSDNPLGATASVNGATDAAPQREPTA